MKTTKDSALAGAALDFVVAQRLGLSPVLDQLGVPDGDGRMVMVTACMVPGRAEPWSPSTDWAIGGPIADMRGIEVRVVRYANGKRRHYVAVSHEADGIFGGLQIEGDTYLQAAMRVLASRLAELG